MSEIGSFTIFNKKHIKNFEGFSLVYKLNPLTYRAGWCHSLGKQKHEIIFIVLSTKILRNIIIGPSTVWLNFLTLLKINVATCPPV